MNRARRELQRLQLEEDTGRDRWILSYADFITLLLAFFVVLYSVSSVNAGKFRVLSDSMITVFAEKDGAPAPIDLGGGAPVAEDQNPISEPTRQLESAVLDESFLADDAAIARVRGGLAAGSPKERLEADLAPLLESQQAEIRDGEYWLEIQLASELLFDSGSADLQPKAHPIIADIATALAAANRPIRVEGYTDNVPIKGGRYGSNWQLSAARAATIAEVLAQFQLKPEDLAATGYGEFHPVADNLSDDGRRKNRRVVVAVAKFDGISGAGPVGGTTVDAVGVSEQLPLRTLQRVTRLPDPAEIGSSAPQ